MTKTAKYIITLNLAFVILMLSGCFPQKSRKAPSAQINILEDKENITFSSDAKSALVKKYKKEAKESDFYWQDLSKSIKEVKGLNPGVRVLTSKDITEFLSAGWGTLILHSIPGKADVHLVGSSTPSEGETTIRKRYREDSYTFRLTKEGYKPKKVNINVNAGETAEDTVKLEKEEETKIIKPSELEHEPEIPDWKKENK